MTVTGGAGGEVKYVNIRASSALSRSGLPGLDYALNPYVGCYHKCKYCYARSYCRYEEPRKHWGDMIYIKKNVVELLRSELKKLRPGTVGLSTTTDPYQPIEAVVGLSRKCLETLLNAGFRVSIQTKSPLVLRDLNLIASRAELVDVGFTITSHDNSLMSDIETRAPPPSVRIEALRRVSKSGVKTWVFLGPIIPGLNDDLSVLEEIVSVADETNSMLYYDWLRFKSELSSFFTSLGLIPNQYLRHGRYLEWRRTVEDRISRLCQDRKVLCVPAFTK